MELPEHIQTAQTLSRELNVRDLEARLTPRIKEEGFTQVSEAEVGKIHDDQLQTTYSLGEVVNFRNPLGFAGFHDEKDMLVYKGDKSTVVVRKRPVYVPDYWKNYWGLDIMTIHDLSDSKGISHEQVSSLPPNEVVLSRLTSNDPNVSIANAFQISDPLHGTGTFYIHPQFGYHQYMNFRKPTDMMKSREEFVEYVSDWTAKLARVNVAWLQNQLKVRSALIDAEQAFQLLMGRS